MVRAADTCHAPPALSPFTRRKLRERKAEVLHLDGTPVEVDKLPKKRRTRWTAATAKAATLRVQLTDDWEASVESGQRGGAAMAAGLGIPEHSVDVSPPRQHSNDRTLANVCSCGVPRVLGVACSHVIAACNALVAAGAPVDVYDFVDPVLTNEAMRHVYGALGPMGLPPTRDIVPDALKTSRDWGICYRVRAFADVWKQAGEEAAAAAAEADPDQQGASRSGAVCMRSSWQLPHSSPPSVPTCAVQCRARSLLAHRAGAIASGGPALASAPQAAARPMRVCFSRSGRRWAAVGRRGENERLRAQPCTDVVRAACAATTSAASPGAPSGAFWPAGPRSLVCPPPTRAPPRAVAGQTSWARAAALAVAARCPPQRPRRLRGRGVPVMGGRLGRQLRQLGQPGRQQRQLGRQLRLVPPHCPRATSTATATTWARVRARRRDWVQGSSGSSTACMVAWGRV